MSNEIMGDKGALATATWVDALRQRIAFSLGSVILCLSMYKKSDLFFTALHVPVDILAISLAFITGYWLKGDGFEIYRLPYYEYMQLLYAAVPFWVLVFVLHGMYTRRHLFGTLQNMSQTALAVLSGWASFIIYLAFLKTEAAFVFPRSVMLYILVFGFVYVFAGRLVLRIVQLVARSFGIGRRRLLLMGAGKLAENLEQVLYAQSDSSITFVKRVDPLEIDAFARELKKYKIDELILADHGLSDNRTLEYIIAAQNAGVSCHSVPNMYEVQSSNVIFTTRAGIPLLTFRQTPLEGWGRIAKRGIDIVLATVGLIVLSPVFVLVAIIIKITDPGPVLYGHTRIGRDGRKFKLLKFRSMITKYCTGPGYNPKSQVEIFAELGRQDLVDEFKRDHKVKEDPRISRIGSIMRKTRLDELPQLINVIRGDLSLVGPRPIVDDELPRYGRWASYLLSIKPGMTGLWQVSGGNDVSYDERVQIDAHYVQNWSLWQDVIIIIKTFLTIFRGKSAY